jgi:2EXR family
MSRFRELLSSLPRLQAPVLRDTFTLFQNMPRELRDQVWGYAASESRVVTLFTMIKPRPSKVDMDQSPHPAILQVNRESREEGLKYYTRVLEKCSGSCLNGIFHDDSCVQPRVPLYINFTADQFHHGNDIDLIIHKIRYTYNFERSVLERIQNLEANYSDDILYSHRWRISSISGSS